MSIRSHLVFEWRAKIKYKNNIFVDIGLKDVIVLLLDVYCFTDSCPQIREEKIRAILLTLAWQTKKGIKALMFIVV